MCNEIGLNQTFRDAARREHVVTLKLNGDYPASTPQCSADLPATVNLRWSSKSSTLTDIVRQYSQVNWMFQHNRTHRQINYCSGY